MKTDIVLPEVIQTARLRLRRWQLADVDDVFTYAQDPEWARYLHMLPKPYTRGDAENFVARQVLLDWTKHPAWAVVLDERPVGGINVLFNFGHRLADIGYAIAREHWRQGLMTEAAAVVIDTAFTLHPDLNRIRAFADAENRGSQRVMEKVGMSHEGVLRQNRVERGIVMDEAWWGILRSEWQPASST